VHHCGKIKSVLILLMHGANMKIHTNNSVMIAGKWAEVKTEYRVL
jgi:hypothetical protein